MEDWITDKIGSDYYRTVRKYVKILQERRYISHVLRMEGGIVHDFDTENFTVDLKEIERRLKTEAKQ